MQITRSALLAIRAHAARSRPQECCGLLLGTATLVTTARPAANIAPNPEAHFEIDPQSLIDAHRAERRGGPELLGYYHSHPTGVAEPSAIDQAHASEDGRLWAIIGGDEITFWRDVTPRFERLPYDVVEG